MILHLTEPTIEMAERAHDLCSKYGPNATFLILSAVMQTLIHMEMDDGDTNEAREMLALCEKILKKKPGGGTGPTFLR